MRILIISQYYYPELNSVNYIAEELSKRGHEVGVITGKPNYGFKKILPEYRKIKKEIINGVTVHRINLKPRKNTRFSVYENYLISIPEDLFLNLIRNLILFYHFPYHQLFLFLPR